MALSNILVEPRREITETLVGIGVLALPTYLDYRWAYWLSDYTHTRNPSNYCPVGLGMLFGALGLAAAILVLLGIHELGDCVCTALKRNYGIQLRPHIRWHRVARNDGTTVVLQIH